MRSVAAILCAGAALWLAGCGDLRDRDESSPTGDRSPEVGSAAPAWDPSSEPCVGAGENRDGCAIPGYADRPFSVYLPSSYADTTTMPVVIFLHGGGGNAEQTQTTTCTDGDLTDEHCLHIIGEREGFITVYPQGTGTRLLRNVRTWNAGGGGPDFACASGYACEVGVDDVAYLNALLDELEREFNVDVSRVYFSGFSNGAAMAHRVGCEMAGRVAAIAPVSGQNQFATSADCAPSRAMPVLAVHGTDDPCWTYVTSTTACADFDSRPKVGVAESTAGWVKTNGCQGEGHLSLLPDAASDAMASDARVWRGCSGGAEVRVITVHGGGHVFPSGEITSPRVRTDAATQDFGAEVIWEFLARFRLG